MSIVTNGAPSIITPRPDLIKTASNYQSAYDWTSKYSPDVHREILKSRSLGSLTGFLEFLANEEGSSSDSYMWAEDGYRHTFYEGVDLAISSDTFTFTAEEDKISIRKNDKVKVHDAGNDVNAEGFVESVDYNNNTAIIKNVEAADWTGFSEAADLVVFVLGSEFAKGTDGRERGLKPDYDTYSNKHIIMKDMYEVNNSDATNEVWFTNGQGGETWYIKDIDETRNRLLDNIEKQMVAGVSTAAASDVSGTYDGSTSMFEAIRARGNNFEGKVSTLTDWKNITKRLDLQRGETFNTFYTSRDQAYAIDDMLAGLNGGYSGGTNYGIFNNGKDTALDLGFSGFNLGGYNIFYQTWKLLKDGRGFGNPSLSTSGTVHGALVPMGNTPIANNIAGNNVHSVPYLTLKFKGLGGYTRKFEEFVLGSGKLGQATSSADKMEVHMRTERSLRTAGANRFFLVEG